MSWCQLTLFLRMDTSFWSSILVQVAVQVVLAWLEETLCLFCMVSIADPQNFKMVLTCSGCPAATLILWYAVAFADCWNNTFLALRSSNAESGDFIFTEFFLNGKIPVIAVVILYALKSWAWVYYNLKTYVHVKCFFTWRVKNKCSVVCNR